MVRRAGPSRPDCVNSDATTLRVGRSVESDRVVPDYSSVEAVGLDALKLIVRNGICVHGDVPRVQFQCRGVCMIEPWSRKDIVGDLNLIGTLVKLESSAPGFIRIANRRIHPGDRTALGLRPDIIAGERVVAICDPTANAAGHARPVLGELALLYADVARREHISVICEPKDLVRVWTEPLE